MNDQNWENEKYIGHLKTPLKMPDEISDSSDSTPKEASVEPNDLDVEINTVSVPNTTSCDVVISLSDQLALFEARKWRVLDAMRRELDDPAMIIELFEMARQRLVDGFPRYGSQMFNWPFTVLGRNEMEEVADRLVYGIAEGDIE